MCLEATVMRAKCHEHMPGLYVGGVWSLRAVSCVEGQGLDLWPEGSYFPGPKISQLAEALVAWGSKKPGVPVEAAVPG